MNLLRALLCKAALRWLSAMFAIAVLLASIQLGLWIKALLQAYGLMSVTFSGA